MTALSGDINPGLHLGDEKDWLLKDDEPVHVGSTILVVSSTGLAERGTTRTGAVCVGVAVVSQAASATAEADGLRTRVRRGDVSRRNSAGDAIPATHPLGSTVYVEDDQTVSATDGSSTQVAAGTFQGFDQNGDPIVRMGYI